MFILIVDNNLDRANNLASVLEAKGHEVKIFLRTYYFEPYAKAIEKKVGQQVEGGKPLSVDLVIFSGFCKIMDEWGQSQTIGYPFPYSWAKKNNIKILGFFTANVALWFNRNFGWTGLKLLKGI